MPFVIYSPTAEPRERDTALQTRADLDATGGTAWISLVQPTPRQVQDLGEVFDLPDLAIQDALRGRQRSKMEDYDDVRFLVLRSPAARGELAETHVFIGDDFVICLDLDRETDHAINARVETDREFRSTSVGILYLLLDAVVDSYEPIVETLGEEIDEAEDEVFARESGVVQRLHELLQRVLRYQRGIHPLVGISEELRRRAPQELRRHFRDIHDHTLREAARIDSFRELLSSAMQVHIAMVGQRQNEEMARMSKAAFEQGEQSKKIASWAAILFTPTVIASVYGMNFRVMPELDARYGYPIALLAMFAAALTLYALFKRQEWL